MFGQVNNPLSNFGYGDLFANGGAGPLDLISSMFQLLAGIAGLYALINMLISGMQYITGQGDPKQVEMAWKRMTMSFIGLAVVVGAFTIGAIISQLFFGDTATIFNPEITGPGTL